MKKVLLASVGNAIECYDFFLYILLSSIISKLFFPYLEKESAFIVTLIVFAVGYIVRPLGAMFWGHFADKHGRKIVFISTIILMSVATFTIACLPTYSVIGIYAPALLLAMRVIQGFSYAGEVPTFATYLYEISTKRNRGLYSSMMTFAGCFGVLMAILLFLAMNYILSNDDILSWGWRIPFFISSIAIIIIGYLRVGMKETLKKNKNCVSKYKSPVIQAFKENFPQIIKIFLFISVAQICFTSYTAYTVIFIEKYVALDYKQSLSLSALSMLYILIFLPIMGFISDRVGLKNFLWFGVTAIFFGSGLVYILLLQAESLFQITLIQILYALICSALLAPVPSFLIGNINNDLRVTTYGISQNFAVAIFGGNTPLILTAIIKYFGNPLSASFYIMFFAVVSFMLLFKMKEV